MESEEPEIKSKQASKKDRTLSTGRQQANKRTRRETPALEGLPKSLKN